MFVCCIPWALVVLEASWGAGQVIPRKEEGAIHSWGFVISETQLKYKARAKCHA